MSDGIEDLLNLPLTPDEKLSELSDDGKKSDEKSDEKTGGWGVKKRDELAAKVLNDIYRQLAEIYMLNSSPVVRARVKQIANDLKLLELLFK